MDLNQKTKYIGLKWEDNTNKKVVVVVPEDNDKFMLTIEQAIDACKAYQSNEKRAYFRKQWDELLSLLKNWVKSQEDIIDKAFLTIRDTGLLFLVVTKNIIFDNQLEDELTELDIKIANDPNFSAIELDLHALPQCDKDNYESFCHPEYILEF